MKDETFEGVISKILFRFLQAAAGVSLGLSALQRLNPFDFHYRRIPLPQWRRKAHKVYTPNAPLDHKPQRELSEKQYQ
jgi:hypothetical protein